VDFIRADLVSLPATIVVGTLTATEMQVQVPDFGVGTLSHIRVLNEYGSVISDDGFTQHV
jgi:hypothetical protein